MNVCYSADLDDVEQTDCFIEFSRTGTFYIVLWFEFHDVHKIIPLSFVCGKPIPTRTEIDGFGDRNFNQLSYGPI